MEQRKIERVRKIRHPQTYFIVPEVYPLQIGVGEGWGLVLGNICS